MEIPILGGSLRMDYLVQPYHSFLYDTSFQPTQSILQEISVPMPKKTDPAVDNLRSFAELHAQMSHQLQILAEQQQIKIDAHKTIEGAEELISEAHRKIRAVQDKIRDSYLAIKQDGLLDIVTEK